MKGRAKVLDSGFIEFIEYLQKIGELNNMVRIIEGLAEMKNEEYENLKIDSDLTSNSGIDLLFPFWRNGWIEIRETERKGKDRHMKEYALLIRLEEIAAYFDQKNRQHIGLSRPTVSRQNTEIPA